jgi:hypothetical protein
VKELDYAIKGDPLQIRREGNDAKVIWQWEGVRGQVGENAEAWAQIKLLRNT